MLIKQIPCADIHRQHKKTVHFPSLQAFKDTKNMPETV